MKKKNHTESEPIEPKHLSYILFMEDWEIEELIARLMCILQKRKKDKGGGKDI